MTKLPEHNGHAAYLGCTAPLLQHMSADWLRRGRSLLEVGCGDGQVLDMLWTLGFDTTGIDADPHRVQAAQERMGGRSEVHLGAYDALPYEDNAYDYVTLINVFTQSPDVDSLLREAVRVATRHVLLIFPNTWSLAGLLSRLPWRVGAGMPTYGVFSMLRRLRKACPEGRVGVRSMLFGPPCLWQACIFPGLSNNKPLPVPFGALAGLRLDMQPAVLFTGLPLHVKASCLGMSGPSVGLRASTPDDHLS